MRVTWGLIVFLFCFTGQAYTNLNSAYSAVGFDPNAPGNRVVVLFSDAHLNLEPGEVIVTNLHSELVNVINQMNPPPAKVIVSGDISTSLANVPGVVFGDYYVHYGTNELLLWKSAILAITNLHQTNIVWIPGNHDQVPLETEADIFRSIFTNMPAYQTFDLGGVRFFLVNSGNYGDPGAVQTEWFRQQVAATSPTQQVAVVTHQPPFHGTVVHRGVMLLLRELFSSWQSRWWILAGHEHGHAEEIYDIGRSNVAAVVVGTANTNVFSGKTHSAGCMFLCLSNGIASRIYYHYDTADFSIIPEPQWENPQHYSGAFENLQGLLWRRIKTTNLAPEMVLTNSVDSRNWWAYPSELRWRLRLGIHGNLATHFLLLCGDLYGQIQMSFSTDQTNWVIVPTPLRTNYICAVPIPATIANAETAYFRFQSFAGGDNFIGGWGLSTTGAFVQPTFPRFSALPEQQAVGGKTFTITNAAADSYAPPDLLKYELVDGPAGASVNSTSAVFAWRPLVSPSPTNVLVTMKVTDSGIPKISDTQQFWIVVRPPATPNLSVPGKTNGRSLLKIAGDAQQDYTIFASTNLVDWSSVLSTNPFVMPFEFQDPSTNLSRRFYRIRVGP